MNEPRSNATLTELSRATRVALVATAAFALPLPTFGQSTETALANYTPVTAERLRNPGDDDWLMYRRTYDGWGYSPLDQITRRNVDDLEPVWTLSTGISEGHEGALIVNDGIMFVTTPLNRMHAVDAATGDILWSYQRQMPFDMSVIHPTNRGVALWGDRVYMATSDAKLLAFDARSGEIVWETEVENYRNGYYVTMAPLAANGKIMVGVSGGERVGPRATARPARRGPSAHWSA